MIKFFKIFAPALMIGIAIGYVGANYLQKPQIKVVQGPVKWKDKVIIKDVNKMPVGALKTDLKCFYAAKPTLDIIQLPENPYAIRAIAGLCGREWEREAKIQVSEKGNFKLYVGIGIGAAATAGTIYIGYRAYKFIAKL